MSTDSVFRELCNQLGNTNGHTPHWPIVLRQLMLADFHRQQPDLAPYESVVPIRRIDTSWENVAVPEEQGTRRLYKTCEDDVQSVLTIGDDRFLLLGWQWPNQGSERMRRADLVGLNEAGGLVVFECKGPDNNDSPFMALLEGLDYLVHLTLEQNFQQIAQDYEARRTEATVDRPFPPDSFVTTSPKLSACHEVIVLAPKGYFETHSRSGKTGGRGHGWREFTGTVSHGSLTLQLRFAATDFKDTSAVWA